MHNRVDTTMIYACMLNSGVGVINPFGEDLHTSRRACPFVSPELSRSPLWVNLCLVPDRPLLAESCQCVRTSQIDLKQKLR
jgi:hypothetical protein